MPRPRELPARARVVIIGGGVGGSSIAYHLAQRGEVDVVLVDRDELTSGSTFHSAGLVGQLRSSVSLTRMMMDSVELYRKLDCGWVECGGVRLACSEEREQEVLRQVAWAKTFGLPLELLSPTEAQELFPLMVTEGVRCASYLPTDGYLDPSMLTYALAEGARAGGCRIFTHTRVTGIDVRAGRVHAVSTQWGDIEAEVVVNAGGMYAAEIGRLAGVRVPVVPFAHEYLVTQPFRERRPGEHLATLRDPDNLIYFREEGGGLVMGGYERHSAPWALDERLRDRIPPDFNGRLLEEDWPRFEEIAQNSSRRVPLMSDVKVTRLINGPEAFTPDNEFCLGETDVRGLYVAAGFCAHGLAGAGGMGKLMAEWILEGDPGTDAWEMDIRRFGAQYASPRYTLRRAREVYETYYDIRYPGHERQAGRPLRTSSAYAWHQRHGAAFGEKSGWERVNWYDANAAHGDPGLRPRGWAGIHWSPAIGAEHRAAREAAALFDESSFSKLEVSGPGAAELLERLCDNHVARDVGQITYTQMLNRRGGIECDFTVTRLEEQRFQIVTGTAFGNHDAGWIRRHLPGDGSVILEDVTSRWACFGLWGPSAYEVLQPLSADELDFGYMRMSSIMVADVPVRALRVTFVGEFGWELYCPTEYGAGLWQALYDAGQPYGLRAGGYRAIDSLRLEKGYRVWAADIGPDVTPYEAGLGFVVREGRHFVGSGALHPAPARRLALRHARGPARGRARQRTRPGRRRDRRSGDERGLRLHRRALDRLRLPAVGDRRGHAAGDRHLRHVGPRRGRRRAALRPGRRPHPAGSHRLRRRSRTLPSRMSVTVVGSIAFDAVKTPFGEREKMLGGAAVHFGLAASFFDEVRVIGPVGDDFGEPELAVLESRGVLTDDIERVAGGTTFFWKGEYGWDLNDRETLDTQLNVFEHFAPKLSDAARQAEVVFLANIQPELQRQVRAQCEAARFVALDSMNLWIEIARDALVAAIREVDCVILNDAELRQLTGAPNLIRAAREILTWGPRVIVAKQGEYGAALITNDGFFGLPAYPLEDVVDPTGAGDTFAGGFVGYIAAQIGRDDLSLDHDLLRRAMAYGTALASFNVEEFGTERVARLSADEIAGRVAELAAITAFTDIPVGLRS